MTLLIQAKGTSAADQGPIIEVRLDGIPIAHTTVRSESWEYYEVELTVERGRSELALVYVNNAELDQASDRNLYLGRVLVAGS